MIEPPFFKVLLFPEGTGILALDGLDRFIKRRRIIGYELRSDDVCLPQQALVFA
jgi:hypothetical protein